MLKPVPSVRLLRALRASVENRKLVCSLCRRGRPWKISQSGYSTRVVPTTSINPQKTIPEEYSDLHERLDAFGRIASVYVNIGQLRLTLKNLEVKNSVTRIAGRKDETTYSTFTDKSQYLESMIVSDHYS